MAHKWHPLIKKIAKQLKKEEEPLAPYTYINLRAGSISSQLQDCIEQEYKKNPDFPAGHVIAVDAPTWARIVQDNQNENGVMHLIELERDPAKVSTGLVGRIFNLPIVSDYKRAKLGLPLVFRFNIAFYSEEKING